MTKPPTLDASSKAMLDRAHGLASEAETKALYSDWAESYDKTMVEGLGYLSPQKAAQLLGRNVADRQARILDVGTGTGLVGQELAALGFTAIDGIDYSVPMLAVAEKLGVYGALIEADLNQPLAIDSNTYDAIICIGTFTHGHVGADCLDELFRIMQPGGRFITAIRKTYWEPAGFKDKVEALTRAGTITTVSSVEESNYTDSIEAESWFLVWEKC
ncbi:MAG: class I SAM-dependent methyltransferase [Rhizobiaceae bacterium]